MRYSDDDLRQSRQKKPNIQGKVPPAEFGTHKEDRDMQEPTRIAGISEDEKECELCRLGNIYDESGKNHRGSGSSSHPSGMEHCKTVDDYTKRL
ncbi:hypothetical protein Tcan_02431 [Toxocara canis]|uniref:Uncharacterized protein n=1 Tax=Toxocara canis TaxID=6265 RepID=A0A0B2UPM1_TOXCA|nr:hypothetical protein Tcan_02431 [Toxocara canis]